MFLLTALVLVIGVVSAQERQRTYRVPFHSINGLILLVKTIALLLLLAGSALGQNVQTTVTATVKDPSGNLYSNCSVTANYVDPPPGPNITLAATINGSPLPSRSISSSCNSSGFFTMTLWDTAAISYGASTGGGTWQFTISSTLQGNVTLPGQPTPPRFSYTAPVCPAAGCITGSSIDISAALQAVAPSLVPPVATLSPSVTVTTGNPITLKFTNPAASRTYTVPDFGSNDSFAGVAATQTLTNKTLVSPPISNPATTGTDSGAETLTNKTIDISANTLKTATNTAGHFPRNNGTQYVDNTIQSADLPATTSPCTGVQFERGLSAGGTSNCATPPTFGASGASHAVGYVPDPGAAAGTTRFLREDATWVAPASGGVSTAYSTVSASTPGSIGATTMATAGASGNKYIFSVVAIQTVVASRCSGNTTLAVNLTFTDASGGGTITAQGIPGSSVAIPATSLTPTFAAGNGGAIGTMLWYYPQIINASASTVVQDSTTFFNGTGCSGFQYYVAPVLLQVQ